MTADYSPKPLAEKLGLKPGIRAIFLHAPEGFSKTLGKLPKSLESATRLEGEFDFIQAFYHDRKTLEGEFLKLRKTLKPSGMIWISWQKGGATDLDRDNIARLGQRVGLEGVSSCAIDDQWSALKFMFPRGGRK